MGNLRRIDNLITSSRFKEGGGFVVNRPIGDKIRSVGPFILLDHILPVTYKPGEAIGAPDHPHRGFETVTYIIDGENQHMDSAGNSGLLGPGDVQWMTAGSGVLHCEMPTDNVFKNGGKSEGFQLWVNLPSKDKMIPPRYQDTPANKMPIVTRDGVWVKVIAGECLGSTSVIETKTPILYLDIRLQPNSSFVQPVDPSHEGFVYAWSGSGTVGSPEMSLSMGQIGILGAGDEVKLTTGDSEELRVLLIAGTPINEPFIQRGPFVMNTEAEIDQAFTDYRSGKFGTIRNREERFAMTAAAVAKQKENRN